MPHGTPATPFLPLLAGLAALSLGCSDDAKEAPRYGEWSTLIEANWTLQKGTEGYTCARGTVPEDMYVSAYRPIAPLGTHHTLFTLGDDESSAGGDGIFECNAGTNGPKMLFGSGVGTQPVEFPPGVAMKLSKGEKMLLNLHLFNTGDDPLSGVSGVEIVRVDPAKVEHEAEVVLAGKIADLSVVPGESTQSGSCEMSHDVTLFATFPHMHQMGSYLKATAVPVNGEPRVLVDGPYSFEDQRYYPLQPAMELKAGDEVKVDCTYQNPTTETVLFGDSSLAEMCFTGLYRYPRGSGYFVCTAEGLGGRPRLEGPPCAEPGAPGNEIGIGKHCTDGGGECASGEAGLCLADFTDGEFGNFCTSTCTDDAECGTGAACVGSSGPKACIPTGCTLPTPDGGSE